MKQSSKLFCLTFVTLSAWYPKLSFALFSSTLDNPKYTTSEITEDVFIKASTFDVSQTFQTAPVFKLYDGQGATFYKWDMPNLENYTTSAGETIFHSVPASTLPDDYLDVKYLTDSGLMSNIRYKVTDATEGQRRTTFNNDELTTNFIGIHTANANSDSVLGGAIHNAKQSINSIGGDFVNNSVKSNVAYVIGGAIYNDRGTINKISGDFVRNTADVQNCTNGINCPHSQATGGAIANIYGNVTEVSGNFIVNTTYSHGGASYGGAIYNGGDFGTIAADFLYNSSSSFGMYGSGGAIANDGSISDVRGDFLGNYAKGFNNVATGGGAISNRGDFSATIGNITGNFISNYAVGDIYNGAYISGTCTIANGGAIQNGGDIESINGQFLNNAVYTYSSTADTSETSRGGALFNSGTINNLTADFIGNYAYSTDAAYGGAIYNSGTLTISAQADKDTVFSDNYVKSESNKALGGAIYNTGTVNLNASDANKITFATSTDTIYNIGTLNLLDGVIEIQNVSNSDNDGKGVFHISGADVYLADGMRIKQNSVIIDSGTLNVNVASDAIQATITNNANVTASNGTITNVINGNGSLSISGDVVNQSNISQQGLTLNDGGALINQAAAILTLNEITGNGALINNGDVYFNGVTLNHSVTGSGTFVVNNDVVSNANIAQSININTDKSLTIDILKLQGDVANNGRLVITGDGELVNQISGSGVINIANAVSGNADNFGGMIVNDGVLQLTTGTVKHDISGQNGTVNITGAVKNAATISQRVEIAEDGVLTSDAGKIRGNIENLGYLYLTGGVVQQNISGTGVINITGNTSSIADKLGNNIVNNALLVLTGGTLSKDITGESGTTQIRQDVTNNGSIAQNIQIISAGKLHTSADNISGDVENKGTLDLTGGLLHADVSGTGVINITGNTTSNADRLGNKIVNNALLTLTGGTLTQNITGASGVTKISQDVINQASIAQNVQIASSARLQTSANGIGSSVENNGTLDLTGGVLQAYVSGQNGTIKITGDVQNNVNIAQQIEVINGASLATNATHISGDIQNFGQLKLTGGTLNTDINNANGTVTITGVVQNAANIAQQIEIIGTLTTDATNISGDVQNLGQLYLTGGTNNVQILGAGTTNITGQVNNKAVIGQDVRIAYNGEFTTDFDNVTGSVLNDGVLNINGGTWGGNIQDYLWANGTINVYGGTFQNDDLLHGQHINAFVDIDFNNGNITESELTANTGVNIDIAGGSIRSTVFNANDGGTVKITNANLAAEKLSLVVGGTAYSSENQNKIYVHSGGFTHIENSDLRGTIIDIDQGATMQADASSLYVDLLKDAAGGPRNFGKITNNGELLVTTGDIESPVYGTGTTTMVGNSTVNSTIYTALNILNTSSVKGSAINFLGDVSNNGKLTLTDGRLAANISGLGVTEITGNVDVFDNDIQLGDVDIADSGTLTVGYNLATNDMNVDGNVRIMVDSLQAGSTIYSGGAIVVNGDLNLGKSSSLQLVLTDSINLEKGQSTGDLSLISVTGTTNGEWAELMSNNRYEITNGDTFGTYKVLNKQSATDVINNAGGSKNNIKVAEVWDNLPRLTGDAEVVRKHLSTLSQLNANAYVKALSNVAPTDTNAVAGTTRAISKAINNQINTRLAGIVGRNDSDTVTHPISVWGQALFNHSAQSGDFEFDGDTIGGTLGADIALNRAVTTGIAYTLSDTDIAAADREINATGHNFAVYGQYHNTNWRLTVLASYGWTDYTEQTPLVQFEYTANNIGLSASAGYLLSDSFTVTGGARYLKIMQDAYTDSIGQEVKASDSTMLTLVAGGEYSKVFNAFNLQLRPVMHAALTYDVINDAHSATVNMMGSEYQITGEAIEPLGVEMGLSIETTAANWDFGLGYDLEWHTNFISHTGRVRAKYSF